MLVIMIVITRIEEIVYVKVSLGEGWGLGFSEAAACKIPIVAPYSTSFMEMSGYGKNAYMLETLYPNCHNIDNVIREQTDLYEVAETLEKVAQHKKEKKEEYLQKIERSYVWTQKLEWKEICKSWIEYFKDIYNCDKR